MLHLFTIVTLNICIFCCLLVLFLVVNISTSGRWQSKMLLTIDERRSKIDRNSVFDRHLLPVRQQMTIKNFVSNGFLSTFLDSISVFDCRLSGVIRLKQK